jgi:hypothetical protein
MHHSVDMALPVVQRWMQVWHFAQSVITFSSELRPKCLRNWLCWTYRFDIVPHD